MPSPNGIALLLVLSVLVPAAGQDSTISGQVTDAATGAPISGATVTLRFGNQTVTTDAGGRYSFTGVKPGDYRVSVRMEGYGIGHSGDSSPMRRLRLSNGQHLQGVDFRLKQEAVITGRVLDSDRNPVPDVTVAALGETYIHGRRDFWNLKTVRTNPNGEYKLAVHGEGTWYPGAYRRVTERPLSPPGPDEEDRRDTALVTFFHNATSPFTAQPVSAISGAVVDGIDLILPLNPVFCVRGTVPAEPERPPVLVSLRLREEDWTSSVLTRTTTAGQFQFCGLPPGPYVVQISMSTEKGSFACLHQELFEVGKRDLDLGELACHPARPVSGKLMLADAMPDGSLPDALHVGIGAYGRRYGIVGEQTRARVQSDGAFTIPGLFMMPYWGLYVEGLPAGYYVKEARMGSRDPRREPVFPGMGELLVIAARDGASLHGQVLDSRGEPVADAIAVVAPDTLSPQAWPRQVRSQVADQSGHFEFDSLPPGKYRLLAFRGLVTGQAENPDFLRPHLSRAVEVTLEPRQSLQQAIRIEPDPSTFQ